MVWPPLHPSHSLAAHTLAVWSSVPNVLWLLLAMTKHWAAPLAAATAGQVPRSTHSNVSQQIPKAIVACAETAWVPLPKEGTPLRNTSSCLWIQRASSLTLTCLTAGTPQYMKNRIIGQAGILQTLVQNKCITGLGQPDLELGPEAGSEGCTNGRGRRLRRHFKLQIWRLCGEAGNKQGRPHSLHFLGHKDLLASFLGYM